MNVYTDSNFPIEIASGDAFTISLESIPSSGYMWKVEYDSQMIELLKPRKFIPSSPGIGSSGKEIFEFQAKQSGETRIKAMYQRMGGKPPLRKKIFIILIH